MPRGGARSGAGRRKGAATKLTREIADKAAAEGITPLEVMLGAMRALWGQATKDKEAVAVDLAQKAADIAKDAAPYMHPRVSPTEAPKPGANDIVVRGGLPDDGHGD
jgi:hypothetical protein